MDATLIEEIANQLGMAVDQTGELIAQHLPRYAELQAIGHAINIVPLTILLLLILVATFKYLSSCRNGMGGIDTEEIPLVILIVAIALVIGLFLLIFLQGNVYGLIGWLNYPEEMLMEKALKAVMCHG